MLGVFFGAMGAMAALISILAVIVLNVWGVFFLGNYWIGLGLIVAFFVPNFISWLIWIAVGTYAFWIGETLYGALTLVFFVFPSVIEVIGNTRKLAAVREAP